MLILDGVLSLVLYQESVCLEHMLKRLGSYSWEFFEEIISIIINDTINYLINDISKIPKIQIFNKIILKYYKNMIYMIW